MAAAPAPRWELLPFFVLRQAGFPFAWLSDLEAGEAAAAADGLLDLHAAVPAGRRAALDALRAAGPGPARETAARAVRDLRAIPPETLHALAEAGAAPAAPAALRAWNRHLDRHAGASRAYAGAFRLAWAASGGRVVRRFRDERWLREMLLLSNESGFDRFDGWLDRLPEADLGDPRHADKLQLLAMYLQRACAKNESVGHYGPFAVGSVAADPGAPELAWREEAPMGRQAFMAHWVAAELARRIGHEPALRDGVRPRRAPFVLRDGGRLRRLSTSGPISLLDAGDVGPAAAALLERCDGSHTAAELAAWARERLPDPDGHAPPDLLGDLVGRGAVVGELEVPAGCADPLAGLAGVLPDGDTNEPWRREIAALGADLRDFAGAGEVHARRRLFTGLRARVAELTGGPTTRGHGRMFADRSILAETCTRELVGLRMGPGLAATIADGLRPFYDLLLLVPRARFVAERELLGAWHGHRFGAGSEVPLAAFLDAFAADAGHLDAGYAAIEARLTDLQRAIDDALLPPDDADVHAVEVDEHRLRPLLRAPGAAVPAVCNPDVMLLASTQADLDAGSYQVLVGDCHVTRDLLSHSAMAPALGRAFPEAARRLVACYQAIVEPDEVAVDVVRGHRNRSSAQIVLPCPDLEVGGRSPKARSDVLHLDDLTVVHTPGGIRLRAPRRGTCVRLMSHAFLGPDAGRSPFTAFSFPRHTHGYPVRGLGRDHLPRLTLGRVVLQREVWRVPGRAFARGLTEDRLLPGGPPAAVSFLRARVVARERGVARRCFALVPGEQKPFYVDFAAPLLVHRFVRMASRAPGPVELGELLPGPEHLWLDGCRSSELRCAVFSVPAG